jgi:5'-nucleotidase / UDP-sugar diphosphatase
MNLFFQISQTLRIPHYALRITLYALLPFLIGQNLNAEETTLTILHTNDTYGQLQPLPTGIGGVLRRATRIHQIRREAPLNLLLDAGDALGPHPLAKFDQGRTVIDVMNRMEYTAMSVGNHELNDGIVRLQQRSQEARFPILCANLRLKATGKPPTERFMIQEIGGIRVGIFGLITSTVKTRILAKHFQPLEVLPPAQTAQEVVDELQRSGCQLIILLSHLGYNADLNLIGQVRGIHLIIGSEVALPEDRTIGAMLPVEGAAGTALVYCPWRGTHLGRVDVRFFRPSADSAEWQLQGMAAQQYRLDEMAVPETEAHAAFPEMSVQLNELSRQYQNSQAGVVGRIREGEGISTLELIPWILREHTGTEVALLNRGSLVPIELRSEIQHRQLSESIRFSSYMTVIELTGAQLKAALAHSTKQTTPARGLLRVGVDANGKTVNGRPIHEAEVYSVVTNDFLAAGGDGYQSLNEARKKQETGVLLHQAVMEFLAESEPLAASDIRRELPQTVWKSKGQIDVMLQGSHVSDDATKYPQISELKSQNTGTFTIGGARLHLSTLRAAPRHSLELRLDSEYRRLRHPATPTLELADSTNAAAIFRYASLNIAKGAPPLQPLVRLEVEDIEFTPEEKSRVVGLFGGGLESNLTRHIKLSTGLVMRRTFEDKPTSELNLDVRTELKWQVFGVELQSNLEWFPTFIVVSDDASSTDEGLLSRSITRWKSTARFPLRKGLSLNGTLFIYRDTRFGTYASATTLALQWGTTWGRKP